MSYLEEIPTRYESKVDHLLARISELSFRAERRLGWAIDTLHSASGERKSFGAKDWKRTIDDCLTTIVEGPYAIRRMGEARSEYFAARDFATSVEALYSDTSKLYTGWSRFFLVTNTNGHIHSSMNCHTCRWNTLYAWLPMLSGLTEADAVAEHGPRLCSECFPSAPVEWTLGIPSDKVYCVGSGEEIKHNPLVRLPRYAKCPHCEKVIAVNTPAGTLRKHGPSKEKASKSA